MKKAIDYYNENFENFFVRPSALITAPQYALKILDDFSQEVTDLFEIRHIVSRDAIISVLREQNQKWNALVRLFEKKHGTSPLKRDGFKFVCEEKLPELKGAI
jgi:ribosomal protein L10